VQKGESLWRIAREYHLDFSRVLELNKHLKDLDLIHPGQSVNTHPQNGQSVDHSANAAGNATAQGKISDDLQATSDTQAAQVLELVNKERNSRGLQPLQLDSKLNQVAAEKARDMAANNYFAHESPTYGSPFEMMNAFGISYRSAAENIAAGQRSAQEVMSSWMNSSGHRANILNPNYTSLGVGYYDAGSKAPYWVQEFTQ
jgi:uncharacterized YkwD family protein